MAAERVSDVRDVVDFHLRWMELRPIASGALVCAALSEDERSILSWLIALADRIGEPDIAGPRADDPFLPFA